MSEKGIPWVKIADASAQNTRFIEWTAECIKEEGRLNTVIVKPGDLIVSNSATPGIPKFMKIDAGIHDGWLLLTEFKQAIKEFVYYLFLNERPRLVGVADGTVFKNLKTDIIRNHTVLIPPLPEQSAIAKILSDLDSKIELNQQMNKTLEAIGQAIFKHWFIDFEFPNEKGNPYKSSGGEMVNSELGEIPKGWKTGKVGDCIEFAYGKGLPETKRQNGVYPVLGSNGIIGSHSEYLVKGPGIVVGRKGTLGEVYWIDKNFFPIDTTFYVVDKLKVGSLYFHYFMLKGKDFLKSSSDSAVPGLNRTIASSQDMIIPSNNIISQFNTFCINLFNRKCILSIQSENLSQIRDSLLPRLMSGKIRVPLEVRT